MWTSPERRLQKIDSSSTLPPECWRELNFPSVSDLGLRWVELSCEEEWILLGDLARKMAMAKKGRCENPTSSLSLILHVPLALALAPTKANHVTLVSLCLPVSMPRAETDLHPLKVRTRERGTPDSRWPSLPFQRTHVLISSVHTSFPATFRLINMKIKLPWNFSQHVRESKNDF